MLSNTFQDSESSKRILFTKKLAKIFYPYKSPYMKKPHLKHKRFVISFLVILYRPKSKNKYLKTRRYVARNL